MQTLPTIRPKTTGTLSDRPYYFNANGLNLRLSSVHRDETKAIKKKTYTKTSEELNNRRPRSQETQFTKLYKTDYTSSIGWADGYAVKSTSATYDKIAYDLHRPAPIVQVKDRRTETALLLGMPLQNMYSVARHRSLGRATSKYHSDVQLGYVGGRTLASTDIIYDVARNGLNRPCIPNDTFDSFMARSCATNMV